MIRSGFILFILFWASLLPVWGGVPEEAETVSWEDCLREASRSHPDLLAARQIVEQARARVGLAESGLFPQVGGRLSAGRSRQDEEQTSYAYSLEASQLIFDGLQSWYDSWGAARQLIAARFDYAVISAQIRFNLRSAFIDLLKFQELLVITEEIVERRIQQAEMVGLRYEGGREHRGALLTAQANLAQARFDRVQAGRDILLAQRRLAKEMGRRDFHPLAARGGLDPETVVDPPPAIGDILELNPTVRRLASELEAVRYGVKSAGADFFPAISGTARIGRSDSAWPPADENWSLGLSLSLPIFEGGRRIDELSRVQAALRQSEERLRSGRDDSRFSLERTWKNYLDSLDLVLIRGLFQAADEERSRIAEAQYSTGILSFDNWIIIEDNLVRSRKALLEARATALAAEAAWLQSRGVSLAGFPSGEPPEI